MLIRKKSKLNPTIKDYNDWTNLSATLFHRNRKFRQAFQIQLLRKQYVNIHKYQSTCQQGVQRTKRTVRWVDDFKKPWNQQHHHRRNLTQPPKPSERTANVIVTNAKQRKNKCGYETQKKLNKKNVGSVQLLPPFNSIPRWTVKNTTQRNTTATTVIVHDRDSTWSYEQPK